MLSDQDNGCLLLISFATYSVIISVFFPPFESVVAVKANTRNILIVTMRASYLDY
jgi:hypothetical protein